MVRVPCHSIVVAAFCVLAACSKADPPPVDAPQLDASATAALQTKTNGSAPVRSGAPTASSGAREPPPFLRLNTKDGWIPAADAERILHIGDSMVPLVGNYLRQVFRKDGRRYEIVSVPSSSTLSWAREHGLRDALYRYDPQVVIISLGSNELFDPNPQRRAQSIRQIVSETRGRPCLWIGPPAWKKDRGFVEVLKNNVGRCRYFDSASLTLDRMSDGRHPSWSGSHAWSFQVWKALGGTQPIPAGDVRPKP